jgi:hypothetical protein
MAVHHLVKAEAEHPQQAEVEAVPVLLDQMHQQTLEVLVEQVLHQHLLDHPQLLAAVEEAVV